MITSIPWFQSVKIGMYKKMPEGRGCHGLRVRGAMG
jgi:hypothetical protein